MTPPDPPAVESVWAQGSRTVSQAVRETAFSRDQLFQWMDDGTLPWFPMTGRGTRVIPWSVLVRLHEEFHGEHLAAAGAGART